MTAFTGWKLPWMKPVTLLSKSTSHFSNEFHNENFRNTQLDTQNSEIKILNEKIAKMADVVVEKWDHNLSVFTKSLFRNAKLDVLAEQVLVNTERNRLTAVNRDDLDRLNHQLKGQSFEVSWSASVHTITFSNSDEKNLENSKRNTQKVKLNFKFWKIWPTNTKLSLAY